MSAGTNGPRSPKDIKGVKGVKPPSFTESFIHALSNLTMACSYIEELEARCIEQTRELTAKGTWQDLHRKHYARVAKARIERVAAESARVAAGTPREPPGLRGPDREVLYLDDRLCVARWGCKGLAAAGFISPQLFVWVDEPRRDELAPAVGWVRVETAGHAQLASADWRAWAIEQAGYAYNQQRREARWSLRAASALEDVLLREE